MPSYIYQVSAVRMLSTQDTVVQNGVPLAVWIPTDQEKAVLYDTWNNDFEVLFDLGASIYAYIFETNPKIKELFPKIIQHGEKWKDSDDFRVQALRLVKVRGIIANLTTPRLFQCVWITWTILAAW